MRVRILSMIAPLGAQTILTIGVSLVCSNATADLIRHTPTTVVDAAFDGNHLTGAAMLADGSFVVLFRRYRTECCRSDNYFLRVSSNGSPVGQPTLVASALPSEPAGGRIMARPEGGWVVVFTSGGEIGQPSGPGVDGSGLGAFARAFNAQGIPESVEFRLNETTAGDQRADGIASLGAGRFVTIWDDGSSLYARFCDANGTLGESILIANGTYGFSRGTFLTSAGDGTFTIAWGDRGGSAFLDTYDSEAHLIFRNEMTLAPFDSLGFGQLAAVEVGAVVAMGKDIVHVYGADGAPLSPPINVSRPGGFVVGNLQGRWAMSDTWGIGASVYVRDTEGNLLQVPFPYYDDLSIGDTAFGGSMMNSQGSLYTFEEEYGADNSDPRIFFPPFAAKLLFKRFCERGDPSCDSCPGYDDGLDSDGDGLADGCDPCSEVAAASTPPSGTVFVSNSDGSEVYFKRTNQIRLSLEMDWTLPFESIPVMAHGMRIRVDNPLGSGVVDAFIPGGAFTTADAGGWTSKAGLFRYQRRGSHAPGGFGRVKIQDLGEGRISVQAKARTRPYRIQRSDSTLTATITLGNQEDAMAGHCSVTSFVDVDCSTKQITSDWYSLKCGR